MLEKIMDLVKGQVMNTVDGMNDIPEDKKAAAIETTTHTLVDSLKEYATPDRISSLMSMFTGGGKTAGTGNMTNSLQSNVASALSSQVGLSPSVSQTLAASVIPMVMSLFKKKVNDDSEPGFNLQSIIGSLAGNGSNGASSGGGVMDMIGGLFGKN